MAQVEYTLEGTSAVVTMNDGDNRFNPSFLETFLRVLDEVEHDTRADVLVLRSAHEKVFSNGIDLDWFGETQERGDTAAMKAFFYGMNALFKRILLYPMPVVAAITGHAFAAGAILCCACDFRFMRSDRGFFCFPEVDVGIPFLPAAVAIARKAMPRWVFDEMQLTGKRLTAEECVLRTVVTAARPMEELMDAVLHFAGNLNKRRAVVREMKRRANGYIVRVMEEEDPPYIEAGEFRL